MNKTIERAIEIASAIKALIAEYEKLEGNNDILFCPTDPTEVHLLCKSFRAAFPDGEGVMTEEVDLWEDGIEEWCYAIVDGVKVFTCNSKEDVYAGKLRN